MNITTKNSKALHIYLIRHGETEWSLSGQHTGSTDIPLTARGEDEARNLGQRLRDIPFAQVLTSPRTRAQRTCELAALAPVFQIEPDLAEWNYGDYEGQRSEDILRARPFWDLFHYGCPGGETPADVSERAARLIARLRAQEGNIALFSHGHFGRVLAMRWIGLPVKEAQHFPLDTASHGLLGYALHHPGLPVIALWNAALADMPAPDTRPRAGSVMTMKHQEIERWENEGGEIPDGQRNQEEVAPLARFDLQVQR